MQSAREIIMNPTPTAYRTLSDEEQQVILRLEELGKQFINALKTADMVHPAGREYALAKTKTEEAVMWAVKGVTG
jgi:hypothetical protein